MLSLFSLIPDQELVRRALREDPRAGEELVFRYQRKACAIVRSMGIRSDKLEDIVQESFLKAFGELRNLEQPGAFGAWFLTIVRNNARNHLRAAARARFSELTVEPPDGAGAPGEKADFEEYIWRKVADLPEGIREAIFLYYHEGESIRAVARALGIDKSAAKNRLFRGRQILRDKLWREMEECLRDMLPSTREWKKRGRRLALLTLTALSLSKTLAANAPNPVPVEAPAAPGPPEPPVPGGSLLTWSTRAVTMGGRKLAFLSLGVLLILGGIGLWKARGRQDREARIGQDAPASRAIVERESSKERRQDRKADAGARPVQVPAAEEEVSIFGRVADAGGQPIAGAAVLAVDMARWSVAAGAWDRARASASGRPVIRLKVLEEAYRRSARDAPREETGADGSYAFRGLADGCYWILASHSDHMPGTENRVSFRRGSPMRCDVALVPGQRIRGKVVGEGGQPIEGAAVSGVPTADASLKGSDRAARTLAGWEEGKILLDQGAARTDAEGAFQLALLEPTTYDLTARKEGWLAALCIAVPAGSADIAITLSRGSSAAGRVLAPSGAPATGAKVSLSPVRSGEVHRLFDARQGDLVPDPGLSAVTGKGGGFRLDAIDEGLYTLSVTAEGFPPLRREVTIGAGKVDLGDLELDEPRAISGIVRGPDGKPVEGARVWTILPWAQVRPARLAERTPLQCEPIAAAKSGADGGFLLSGLPEGIFELKAEALDLARASARAPAGTSGLVMDLEAGLTIHGRVVEEGTGAPIAGAEVRVPAKDGQQAFTDDAGRFAIHGVPVDSTSWRGNVLVEGRHPELGWFRSYEPVQGHGEDSPLEIRVCRMRRIAGRVVDASGSAVEGVRVWLEAAGLPMDARENSPFGDSRGFSSADGSFSISIGTWAMWLAGDIRVFAVASDRAAGSGRVGPLALPRTGEPWPDIEVVLSPGEVVEGAVIGEDGTAVSGARVFLERVEPGVDRYSRGLSAPGRIGYSLPDGRFKIEGAERGPSRLIAEAVGFAPQRIEGIPVGELPARVTIILEQGHSIAGRVVDRKGAPFPLAEVVALPVEEEGEGDPEFARRMDLFAAPGIATTRTGLDGRYRLGPLPRGSFQVVARCEGHEAARVGPVSAAGAAPDIVLTRFAALEGAVLDSLTKEPVTSFRVNVISKKKIRPEIPEDLAGSEGELQFDDALGRFLYDGLRPGEYVLLVTSRGYGPHRREVTIPAGEEIELSIPLEKGFRIEGILLDEESGLPVAGAQVSAQAKDTMFIPRLDSLLDAVSLEDGSFSIPGLSPGEHALFTVHPFYRVSGGKELDFRIPGAESSRLEVRLSPAGRLQGWIHGLDPLGGSAAERPFLIWVKMDGKEKGNTEEEQETKYYPEQRISLFPDGRCEADSLAPGKYRLELHIVRVEVLGKVESGPDRSAPAYSPTGNVGLQVLGEVEIRPREITYFEFDL